MVTLLDADGFKTIRQWIERDAAFALALARYFFFCTLAASTVPSLCWAPFT